MHCPARVGQYGPVPPQAHVRFRARPVMPDCPIDEKCQFLEACAAASYVHGVLSPGVKSHLLTSPRGGKGRSNICAPNAQLMEGNACCLRGHTYGVGLQSRAGYRGTRSSRRMWATSS